MTQAVGAMEVVDVPEPPDPGPGEVVIGSMAVGICGSDYHFFAGHLTEEAGGGDQAFPKIQDHEVGGTVTAVGEGCRPELEEGRPVALHPLSACGECYPCRAGRPRLSGSAMNAAREARDWDLCRQTRAISPYRRNRSKLPRRTP